MAGSARSWSNTRWSWRTVIEVGSRVWDLAVGDRVCMEPGTPDLASRASRLGLYNIDPAVRFWATPPVHGVPTEQTVHPAAFTFWLPDAVSFAEAAMVEPFAVGMQAAARARIAPGDVAVVIGCGPIGSMVALAALAGVCSRVLISDLSAPKLAVAARYDGLMPIDVTRENLRARVVAETGGRGTDIVFEASGSPRAYGDMFSVLRPGGAVILVGLPVEPVQFDVNGAIAREACI
jgi:D-xylulose reductase